MPRDKEKTKTKILTAVRDLLVEEGFQGIGINAIARKAGVDKVLIYRYFGGLPELFKELARTSDFWPTIGELIGDGAKKPEQMDFRELSTALLRGRLRELRKRPATQQVMRWELIQRNELTDALHRERESQGEQLFDMLPPPGALSKEIDVPAMAAVLVAGVVYLVLRSNTADTFQGVDLHSEEGWARIERAVGDMISICFEGIPSGKKVRKRGIK